MAFEQPEQFVRRLQDADNITERAYDGYGRLEQVWLPSEHKASDPASLAFVYDAAVRPAHVKSRTLQVKGSSTYLECWQYVDGFGRGIQTQAPAATNGNRIVTSQQYDNLGQFRYQSAPYQLSGAAGSGYSAPTWNTVANYHQFYYDELGRQTKDETRSQNTVLWDVETTYDAWTQQRYDANNHRRDYAYNAFGQLVQVQEYYATTSFYTTGYAYDLLGNLTGVTDHLSNVTSMSYDLLGRTLATATAMTPMATRPAAPSAARPTPSPSTTRTGSPPSLVAA
jgi:YD repeat-containing protein